jgi:hypothetical protein
MPRLPVSKSANGKPLVVTIGYSTLAIGGLLVALFVAGDLLLPDLLGLDLDCTDAGRGRRARVVEVVGCSLAAGPVGWLYLAWVAAPVVLFGLWLRSRVRRATPDKAAKP